jgi:hypothetical protein
VCGYGLVRGGCYWVVGVRCVVCVCVGLVIWCVFGLVMWFVFGLVSGWASALCEVVCVRLLVCVLCVLDWCWGVWYGVRCSDVLLGLCCCGC